jgi:hypothetical protein
MAVAMTPTMSRPRPACIRVLLVCGSIVATRFSCAARGLPAGFLRGTGAQILEIFREPPHRLGGAPASCNYERRIRRVRRAAASLLAPLGYRNIL